MNEVYDNAARAACIKLHLDRHRGIEEEVSEITIHINS